MKTPRAEIHANGRPVASIFNDRLISVTITDKAGVTSDTISCELNDGNPFAEIPRKGDTIEAWLGYVETGIAYFGRFICDDPVVHCLPYRLTVNGKGTDMREKLKQHKARHWDRKSVRDIVSEIAGDHGLQAKVDGAVGAYKYEWFGQEDESDLHVVERLARRHDATFAIKNGMLILAPRGSGKSPSGAALTPVIATPFNIVKGTCQTTFAHRNSFAKVRAHAQDRKKAERVEVDEDSDDDGDADYTIPEPFADQDEAQRAARTKARDLKANTVTTSVDLFGDPTIRAAAPFRYAGVRPQLDGIAFIVETATHKLSKQGYTTSVEAKLGGQGSGGAGKSAASAGDVAPGGTGIEVPGETDYTVPPMS
jgi:phage protein D